MMRLTGLVIYPAHPSDTIFLEQFNASIRIALLPMRNTKAYRIAAIKYGLIQA